MHLGQLVAVSPASAGIKVPVLTPLITGDDCNTIQHFSHARAWGFCCVSGLGVRRIRPCPVSSVGTRSSGWHIQRSPELSALSGASSYQISLNPELLEVKDQEGTSAPPAKPHPAPVGAWGDAGRKMLCGRGSTEHIRSACSWKSILLGGTRLAT